MKFREKWTKSWGYGKKLQFFMIVVILVVTLLAIFVSTAFSVSFLTKQNKDNMAEQLSAVASEYSSTLEQYKAVAFSLVMDKHVQAYCAFKESSVEMSEEAGNVYNTLLNMLYIQNNANFMVITSRHTGSYIFNGNKTLTEARFDSAYETDYENSIQAKEQGALRLSFGDGYFKDGVYSLTLYFPVYSVTHMVTENGMVVINLEDSLLEHLNSRSRYTLSSLYLTDRDGKIVSNKDTEQIGRTVAFGSRLEGSSGSFWDEGKLVNYQRIGEWNYYLVNEITAYHLYQNCFSMIVMLLLLMVVVMAVAVSVSGDMAKKLYKPINKVVSKMNVVSSGNLRTRINTADMDSDSLKLADGFNSMMDEIDILMDQVKEEQRQIAQMKFNGLQSQIQPHFLYNTLECIHWQAVSDGSREVSTMVKALAHYYRICLSEGQEIIPLRKELEHVENYLIIQNLRYGDIIKMDIQVPEEYLDIRIPKITLQPLVENSIYHGIRVKEGRKGKLSVFAEVQGEDLILVLEDNGQGMSQEKVDYINQNILEFDKEIGYGINNVNKRIELLYGNGCGLYYSLNGCGGVRVEIRLPVNGEIVEGEHVSDTDC